MSEKLAILISAELNMGSSVKSINDQLKILAKHPSLQKLNIKINVDESFVKSINKFIDSASKLNVALSTQNKVVQETITEHRKLDGSIEKTTQQILKNGEVINRTKTVHDANKKSIQSESSAYESQRKTIKQLERELSDYTLTKQKATTNATGQITGYNRTYKNDDGNLLTVRTDENGIVKKYDEINDFLKRQQQAVAQEQTINKQREQIAKEEYNTRKALQDKTEKEQVAHYKQLEALDKAHYQALKTDKERKEALEKAHYLALQQNAKREQQYQKTLTETETKIADIRRRFSNDSSVNSGLMGIESQLGQLKSAGSIGDFKSRFEQLNTQLKQVTANAKQQQAILLVLARL